MILVIYFLVLYISTNVSHFFAVQHKTRIDNTIRNVLNRIGYFVWTKIATFPPHQIRLDSFTEIFQ